MAGYYLGDRVRLDDGREGQLWLAQAEDAFTVCVVLLDGTAVDVRPESLTMLERMFPLSSFSSDHTAKLVRAKSTYDCAGRPGIVKHFIRRGDVYVLSKVFPGHESGAATSAPVSKRLCTTCAAFYPDTDPARLAAS